VRRPSAHAAAVAVVIAAGALLSIFLDPSGAHWTHLAAAVVMAPCAWLGGALAARQKAS
jgi:hypothetical protein